MATTLEVYTDGGCWPNPGKAAWAWVAVDPVMGCKVAEASGQYDRATNQVAELTACLNALQHYPTTALTLYSDSQYCVKGITAWMHRWEKKGWKRKDNARVANLELWKELYEVYNRDLHTLKWIKGHSGVYWNEYVDSICNSLINSELSEEDSIRLPEHILII